VEQINFSYHIYLDEIELTQEYIDFVLYVSETKNSSNTCFFNPGYPYVHTHEYISKPKKGKIILFDKAIPHSVEPNKDEERLIVSGNIVFNECSL
jgi:hypothetical protein